MADRNQSVYSTSSGHAHRKSVAQEPVTSVLKPGEVVFDPENPNQEWNQDEEVLAALGYKPEFKREFNLWTTFCVSFAVLGLLPSFASTLYYGMGYAGTAGWSNVFFLISFLLTDKVSLGCQTKANTFLRHDMGMASSHDRHPSRRSIDGRIV